MLISPSRAVPDPFQPPRPRSGFMMTPPSPSYVREGGHADRCGQDRHATRSRLIQGCTVYSHSGQRALRGECSFTVSNADRENPTYTIYIIYEGVRHFKIGLRNDSCTECCGSGSVGFELFRIRSRILVIFIRIRNTHFLYQKNNFHTKKQDPGLQHLQYFDNFTGSL